MSIIEDIKRHRVNGEQDKLRDAMVLAAAKLRMMVGEKYHSGWEIYEELIRDYINKCKERKMRTPLSRAAPDEIRDIQLLDHEIWILSWLIDVPHQYIERAERMLDKERRRERRDNINKET